MQAVGKRLGLVLPGGGAKGAYQVGVFRALRELGIDQEITAVAGTSIGALNAVLFAQGDLDEAEALWTSTHPAMFSRQGLEETLDRYLRPQVIAESPLSLIATCMTGFPLGSVTYFGMNGCSEERLRQILRATSALPLLFDPVTIDGVSYTDGGVGIGKDNIPVNPLYMRGCDRLLVVHLKQHDRVDPRQFPGAEIIEIHPSRSLGDLISGNLDFRGEGARWRMELGHRDAFVRLTASLQHSLAS